jgi:poly(A) polymerase
MEALQRFGLTQGVFPILDAAWVPAGASGHNAQRERFIRLALEDTDRRVADDRPVAPSFLLACLLWQDVQDRWTQLKAEGLPAFPALQQAIDAVFDARIGDISGRGKLAADMREIWQMQTRFERRTPSAAASLVEQPRFRAGFDFLRLRADVGEVPPDLAEWWEDYSLGTDEEREALLRDLKGHAKSHAPRRVPGPRRATPMQSATPDDAPHPPVLHPDEAEPTEAAGPARKRRRRRRRTGGSSGASDDAAGPSQA